MLVLPPFIPPCFHPACLPTLYLHHVFCPTCTALHCCSCSCSCSCCLHGYNPGVCCARSDCLALPAAPMSSQALTNTYTLVTATWNVAPSLTGAVRHTSCHPGRGSQQVARLVLPAYGHQLPCLPHAPLTPGSAQAPPPAALLPLLHALPPAVGSLPPCSAARKGESGRVAMSRGTAHLSGRHRKSVHLVLQVAAAWAGQL